jgi:glutamate-1-semialdehyde 2,1-aminomutase
MGTGQNLYKTAKSLIPGGTQLLSKRPEMFLPEQWPAYYRSARGITVTDMDGHEYKDFSLMGIGACILGYADDEVNRAVKEAVDNGVACTLNAPEEVELAQLLCELHPWAQMVRYARSGGEAMSVAIRIARAHTKRDKVAFCGYHGWTDWYLAANLGDDSALDGHLIPGLDPSGVPRGLKGSAMPFHFNQIDQLKALVAENKGELAAIIMEPQREDPPEPGFVQKVRDIASECGAVLIFDEISIGFRLNTGGAHLVQGIVPDMAVFAKAMANGYAMSTIIGSETVMQSAQSTFISSTNWTERIGPVAALATIRKHGREQVPRHLEKIGALVLEGWQREAEKAGVLLHVSGLPCLPHFSLKYEDELALATLFTSLMLEKGYLAWGQFKPSLAHTVDDVADYLRAFGEVLPVIAEAAHKGDAASRLPGGVARRGFYRLTK